MKSCKRAAKRAPDTYDKLVIVRLTPAANPWISEGTIRPNNTTRKTCSDDQPIPLQMAKVSKKHTPIVLQW